MAAPQLANPYVVEEWIKNHVLVPKHMTAPSLL